MDEYIWCSRCERAFIKSNDEDTCAYDDCSGKSHALFKWKDYQKQELEAPDIPEIDTVYRLDYFINEI
ncbi:MAG TPA: hypothetical protein DEZ08_00250 [Dehalococcoidia bacterium]|jgi:hypothetical protein|nr:hypothetical protein [Dehalococcoidia bacterium]|tara:strand:+ start:128 stop:331 length:204 start_codon:yes stop_codon:yes gene_type:complete